VAQQPAFDAQLFHPDTTHKTTQASTRGDNTMARHDHRQWIPATSLPHRAWCRLQLGGKFTIGERFPMRDTAQRFPNLDLMLRTGQFQRQVKFKNETFR
jgi:hypothetical protein